MLLYNFENGVKHRQQRIVYSLLNLNLPNASLFWLPSIPNLPQKLPAQIVMSRAPMNVVLTVGQSSGILVIKSAEVACEDGI